MNPADEDPQGLDPAIAAMIAQALPAPALAAEARARLKARVLERASGIHVVRAEEGRWIDVWPGIQIKRLRPAEAGHGRETSLWRLAPGSVIPAHRHDDDEECLVLEGSIEQDGIRYSAGDYLHARKGSLHGPLCAPAGALLLIRSRARSAYLASSRGA
jgi:quercetin dioxygenase-like cupin family protein